MLEINFLESEYSIVEGSTELSSPIMIQLRQNQNPFTLMLSPVTIDAAESKGLDNFIDSQTILPGSRATAGTTFLSLLLSFSFPYHFFLSFLNFPLCFAVTVLIFACKDKYFVKFSVSEVE